jgi:nucleotide-binding universal stress UspA family protein
MAQVKIERRIDEMKIMVGYDGSSVSKTALDVGIMHVKAFKGRMFLVSSMTRGTEGEQERIKATEKELVVLKSDLEAQGIACETHLLIRGMEPGEDLVHYAQEQQIDEIIIGIRRRSKVGKLLFGSTAQYVILNAECPVVTVR